jgi:hypothetical protein
VPSSGELAAQPATGSAAMRPVASLAFVLTYEA